MENEKRKKVLVAGTFDIIHPGHIYFINEAKKLGDVVVIVARDSTVKKIKGRDVVVPELQRLEVIRNIKGVKEAYLGHEGGDFLKIVEEIKPDLILLGPNQPFDDKKMKKELEGRGLKIDVIKLKRVYDKYPLCSTRKILKKVVEVMKDAKLDYP